MSNDPLGAHGLRLVERNAIDLAAGDYMILMGYAREIIGVAPAKGGRLDVHYEPLPGLTAITTRTYSPDDVVGIVVQA